MSRRTWARAAVAVVLVPPLLALAPASPSFARDIRDLTGRGVAPADRADAAKTTTAKLAKTDPSLLARTEATPVQIIVKLDYDSTAEYKGNVAGYAATSPSVTGKPLSGGAAEQRYESRIAGMEGAFLGELAKRVPSGKVGQRLRTVYGGLAVTVPANKVKDVTSIRGVVAVQRNEIRKPLTDSSPGFIGATGLYPALGGKPNAGKGTILGVLDTGLWPEHPSMADQGNLGAPPVAPSGSPRVCDFGDNPRTPANDPFVCNRKLIGGQPFLEAYTTFVGPVKYPSARDSEGHGTHTATTAAGNAVSSAPVLGVDRGPINGVAPGAWVMAYKVCGPEGCFSSDSVQAVAQAIKDGVNVINFSIGGGANPATDAVELAFREAYAAGIFVAASAGNDGPGASTAEHLSPWVTTVAASTQRREFRSTLTVTAGGASATYVGASLTKGAGPAPVVLAETVPGYAGHPLCDVLPPSDTTFAGKIIACQRGGNARVEKGYHLSRGGALGMVLYNATLADTETDNHWLPTVHLPDGTEFKAFLAAHPDAQATFTAGAKADGVGDVMAAFSSRGPGGNFIKPDVTAPGVQILAGHTPTPESVVNGPPGEYYQAIAGTSMSSPHVAGSALLLRALHPTWTPGQIKSALMTTATTKVVKEDLKTPADPFDDGAGRIQVDTAGNPGLTFDETATRMRTIGTDDPINAVHLNLPSINAPVMPGRLTTVRTAVNVTNRPQTYRVESTAPARSSITVFPSVFTVAPGKSVELSITIRSTAPKGQYFGEVRLAPVSRGLPTLHLPVAFIPQQGVITLASSCNPDRISLFSLSTCQVTATNTGFGDATVDLESTTSFNLPVTGASGAAIVNPYKVEKRNVTVTGAVPGTPSLEDVGADQYFPMDSFGAFEPVGDESMLNYDVPGFRYNGVRYTRLGVTSNGYLVAGGGTAEDLAFEPTGISPARPNNYLAPFWTDLTGDAPEGSGSPAAPGVLVTAVTNGTDSWVVVEWRVYLFGTTQLRTFQTWLGLDEDTNPAQDITFSYVLSQTTNPGLPYLIGAENLNGSGGEALPAGALPTGDIRVVSTDPKPGSSVGYSLTVRGLFPAPGAVTTRMDSPQVPGETVVRSPITVTGWRGPPME